MSKRECMAGIFTVRQQVTGRKQAVLEHREQAGHFPLLLQLFLCLICRADSYSLTGRMSRKIKEMKGKSLTNELETFSERNGEI